MKKIRVTIIMAATEEFPGCADILGIYPEIEIIARCGDVHEPGAWSAIECSDVLIFDEAAQAQTGTAMLRSMQHGNPFLKLLLIIESSRENSIMDAISEGFSGVIERAALRSVLRRAIPALYAGEAWVSRRIARMLRTRLLARDGEPPAEWATGHPAPSEKFN
jgi:DNA-binding NarL/FixJ family response regulator